MCVCLLALQLLLYAAASCALLTGSTCEFTVPKNCPLLLAMASAIVSLNLDFLA